jgi:cytochrome c oxidase cbb3-type subunit III
MTGPGSWTRALRTAALLALALPACREERIYTERLVPGHTGEALPVHTTSLFAGQAVPTPSVRNPYEGNVHATRDGERLYLWFNCAGCHGAIGGGGIGPPLRDRDWIYGGTDLQIYRSIVEGRPQGMPSYRGVSEDALWRLVAYVRSLGEPGAPGNTTAVPAEALREPIDEALHEGE